MIKIIFFDIDGTLLQFKAKDLTPNTKAALLRLQAAGIKICIATGRPPVTMPKFEGIDFDAYMTFNGSYCFDKTHIMFDNPIPAQDVQQLLRNTRDMGRAISIATKDRLVANGTDPDLEEYYAIARAKLVISEDFDRLSHQNVYQMILGCNPTEYDRLLKDAPGAKITAWCPFAGDIIPANGGKGAGVRAILRHYGIDPSEAMAFGDGDNDIPLLEAVGTGVAMGNGSDMLKAIADAVCGSVDEDGIYHYCLEQGLI